ncbi:MAG: type III-A CRISPR-associated protein Cas10/Csm1 [Coriobacteriia bacterium]|nr:type III-A CRISPR-associated protein Cas10/Csm1 [Coriobacteriia bacterium]
MDRKNEGDEADQAFFEKDVDLRKIFNIIGGHQDDNVIPHDDYNRIREDIKRNLSGISIDPKEVNSLLHVLEATTRTVPSSTNTSELVDVSLYDHSKTTAGLAACVYDYLAAKGVTDYRKALFSGASSQSYYYEPMFLLSSFDMSGIQDFIYNISGSGALKQLRARSLYLDFMMEHIVDELLDRLSLNRSNVLYIGGGHSYLILPNTDFAKNELSKFLSELKAWFISRHGTDLYLAAAYVECSSDDLANKGEDKQRFPGLFRELSARLSTAKASRYTAADIAELNFSPQHDEMERECQECHRSSSLVERHGVLLCSTCASLHDVSADLVGEKNVFAVIDKSSEEFSDEPSGDRLHLELPFGAELVLYRRDRYLSERPLVRRVYTKNDWEAGIDFATHVWIGDYTADTDGQGVSSYAIDAATIEESETLEGSKGIKRLGVLRADVDNLGAAFANGFPCEKASISRTATLSRALSLFFKKEINEILEKSDYRLQIIYSGGDDLFIVGNWSDVLYAAIDIRNEFKEFTGNGCLTISAGIGMFGETYPIARMASEAGELEDVAKLCSRIGKDGSSIQKDAVTLWRDEMVFGWDYLVDVVEPRMRELREIFEANEKGKAFIYRMLALLRDYDQVISAPRFAYLLARSFEYADDADALSKKFYSWALDGEQRKCLVAALEWYVYSIRERG